MTKPLFSEIHDVICAAQRILLLSHVRPDGDALGSQLALSLSLLEKGISNTVWTEDGVPERLAFLPGADRIAQPPIEPEGFDLVVALDTAAQERVGPRCLAAVADTPCWINIDHHASNLGYGSLNLIDLEAPATGQIIYDLITQVNLPLTREVATNLYVAISTDTGSFQYSRTTAHTHQVAAELLRTGIDVGEVNRLTHDSMPRRQFELLRRALETVQFRPDGRVAWIELHRDDFERTSARPEDTETLVDHVRAIDEVVVAVLLEEQADGRIRVSSRSKDARVDVGQICASLGGGGHPLAAGTRMPGPLPEARQLLMKAINEAVDRI